MRNKIIKVMSFLDKMINIGIKKLISLDIDSRSVVRFDYGKRKKANVNPFKTLQSWKRNFDTKEEKKICQETWV